MKISRLCFADDLLNFCKGDMKSISLLILTYIRREMSRLSPNSDKSNLFTYGLAESIKGHILDILSYWDGVLPRILGYLKELL